MSIRPFYTPPPQPHSALTTESATLPGTTITTAGHAAGAGGIKTTPNDHRFPFPLSTPVLDIDRGNPLVNDLTSGHARSERLWSASEDGGERQAGDGEREEVERGDDEDEDELEDESGLTPLDVTLEKIGIGRYQQQLAILCGLGWMADNVSLINCPSSAPFPRTQWDVLTRPTARLDVAHGGSA